VSVASELQDAARAIRAQVPATATFHRATAALLDQIALSAPLVEMHLPPITTKALVVARAYMVPGAPLTGTGDELRGHLRTVHHNLAADGLPDDEATAQHLHEHFGPGGLRNHDQPARLHSWVGAR
jgi:hypothetical protein